jgi:hypothetical protein
MIFSDDRATKDALLTLLATSWRQHGRDSNAIEVDSRPGTIGLAAAKKLEAAVAEIVAAGAGRLIAIGPFEFAQDAGGHAPILLPAPLGSSRWAAGTLACRAATAITKASLLCNK